VITDRLVIRAALPPDTDAVLATVDDEVITANSFPPAYLATLNRIVALGAGSRLLRVICLRGSGEIIGVIQPYSLEQMATDRSHIGMWLGPHARRQGYGREALRGYVADAHERGHRVVVATTHPDNAAVCHLLESEGFVETARHEPDAEAGRPHATISYEHVVT
jgi:RimJ/RimL family protein N-acetyltransferase